jgi:hypothetical protein
VASLAHQLNNSPTNFSGVINLRFTSGDLAFTGDAKDPAGMLNVGNIAPEWTVMTILSC